MSDDLIRIARENAHHITRLNMGSGRGDLVVARCLTDMAAKIESDAKVIADLRARLEDTGYPLGEIDGLMKVIATLRERMTHIRAFVSAMSEANWRDIGAHIARQATDEQNVGENK